MSQLYDDQILCPIHFEVQAFISPLERKCSYCQNKKPFDFDQFLDSVGKYRLTRIQYLQQSQQTKAALLAEEKQLLIRFKQMLVASLDTLIRNIDEKTEKLISEYNRELTQLTKPINSLSIPELKKYSNELKRQDSIIAKEQFMDQIQNYLLQECDRLYINSNILKQLQDFIEAKNKIPAIKAIPGGDPLLCVGNTNIDIYKLQIPKEHEGLSEYFINLCPSSCNGKVQKPILWCHSICGNPLFIDETGDLYCQNYTNRKGCQKFFLQQAKFQCTPTTQPVSHQTAGQYFMCSAQCAQFYVDFSLSSENRMKFDVSLNHSLLKKWKR